MIKLVVRCFLGVAVLLLPVAAFIGAGQKRNERGQQIPRVVITTKSLSAGEALLARLPEVNRYEASRSYDAQSDAWRGAFTIANRSGEDLNLSLSRTSCGCARVEAPPGCLASGGEKTVRVEPAVGLQRTRELSSMFLVKSKEEAECSLEVRRKFNFVPAVTVSPPIVYMKEEGDTWEGRFYAMFSTDSAELAKQAALRFQNAPYSLEIQMSQSECQAKDGGYSIRWDVRVVDRDKDLYRLHGDLMTFAMVTSGPTRAWSAPMQFRRAGESRRIYGGARPEAADVDQASAAMR